MRVQRAWLWSHVYLDEGELDHAEGLLLKALLGFQNYGSSQSEALANLVQFYFRSRNHSGLNRVLPKLVTALRQPGNHPGLADEVEQLLEDARPNDFETSKFQDLMAGKKTWIQ